jgi:hypothetical protein
MNKDSAKARITDILVKFRNEPKTWAELEMLLFDVVNGIDDISEKKPVSLPPGSGIDWLIASGATPEAVQKTLDKEARIREVTQAYEKYMGYSPLEWGKLERLQRFLLTKSVEDIQAFAKWSKREYSVFRPEKARLYPNMVIEMWGLAFEKPAAEQDTQSAVREALYGKRG